MFYRFLFFVLVCYNIYNSVKGIMDNVAVTKSNGGELTMKQYISVTMIAAFYAVVMAMYFIPTLLF